MLKQRKRILDETGFSGIIETYRFKRGLLLCTNKEAVENAAASIEMEGFNVSEQSKLWCEQLLNHEITFEEYLARALKQVGVSA